MSEPSAGVSVRTLHQGWRFRSATTAGESSRAADWHPASVPGCVHTDLMAAGLMPDPYLDQNEHDCQWPRDLDWEYETTFDAADVFGRSHVDLAFDGIDTVAEVSLNGEPLAFVQDMHVRHRFAVKDRLQASGNTLRVKFKAPLPWMMAREAEFGRLPATGAGTNPQLPHVFMRKMSCNSGWDWGPQLLTVGLWRPVKLEAYDGGRIIDVVPNVTRDGDSAVVDVKVNLAGRASDVSATLLDPSGREIARGTRLVVESPQWWYPHTHGPQPLYTLRVEAGGDVREVKLGLRTSELVTTPDDVGSRYLYRINGRDVFVRGANWIPDDCFPHRVTRDRYRDRIVKARDAGINLLRVWGGGTYESDDFYEVCSELGVMVQQDFLMACGFYPEEDPYPRLVEAEARDNVSRLSRHCALILWNGCNENLWAYHSWKTKLPDLAHASEGITWGQYARDNHRTWGAGYYFEMYPRVVGDISPSIPYWPGSPYPGSMDLPANCDEHGTRHEWARRFEGYRESRPRFMAEYGAQGMANWATISRALPSGGLEPHSDALEHRQKASGKNLTRVHEPLEHYFGHVPDVIGDYHFLTQIVQVRQVAVGAEWWRSTTPRCMGIIYWQFNDCWPVTSWAAIDGDGCKKLLWYATRRFYADRFLTIQPEGDTPHVVLHNDADAPVNGSPRVRVVSLADGSTRDVATRGSAGIAARGVGRWDLDVPDFDPANQTLVADLGGMRAWYWGTQDHKTRLPAPDFSASARKTPGGYAVTVAARSVIRDLCLLADHVLPDADVADQMVTLLPGESYTFEVKSAGNADPAALTRRPVLRCVNEFSHLTSPAAP